MAYFYSYRLTDGVFAGAIKSDTQPTNTDIYGYTSQVPYMKVDRVGFYVPVYDLQTQNWKETGKPIDPRTYNGFPYVGPNNHWYQNGQDLGVDITGPQGPKGADGKTPVRGTDYWTTTDQNTIKQWVEDAILNDKW
jgi:hypothetical protein